jgi:hypothetical protein
LQQKKNLFFQTHEKVRVREVATGATAGVGGGGDDGGCGGGGGLKLRPHNYCGAKVHIDREICEQSAAENTNERDESIRTT